MRYFFNKHLAICTLFVVITFVVLQGHQVNAINPTLPNPTVIPSSNVTGTPLPTIITKYPPTNATVSTLPNPTVIPSSNGTTYPLNRSNLIPYSSFKYYYTDTVDSNGNIHRHYSNYSDYSTHEDLTIDVVKVLRVMRIIQLNNTIQSLPYSSFANPVVDRQILQDNATVLKTDIEKDEFHFAIAELQGMKQEILGIAPYSSALLVDASAQEKVIPLIDGIIHTTILASKPSDSFYQNVSPPIRVNDTGTNPGWPFFCQGGENPFSQWICYYVHPKGSSVLWASIIGLIIASIVLGVSIYKVSVTPHKI